jgi:hypothetical protein
VRDVSRHRYSFDHLIRGKIEVPSFTRFTKLIASIGVKQERAAIIMENIRILF